MANNLGRMIRDARERAGLTMDDVTLNTGVSKGYLCQVENDYPKATFSLGAAMKVGRVIGLDGDELAARCYLKRVPPELWPYIRKVLNDHLLNGTPVA